ncbi:unnamed protein product [Owenia fusiformis]|uniref:Uncharacterized protein n=1 Tax=Owenia fusiformis TaxID=6347 RepID=A0A8J1TNN0_OWEFU|nr:unnamed protein product [Owenia fusiformis]
MADMENQQNVQPFEEEPTDPDGPEPETEEVEKTERIVRFPITRIKTIMKQDPDVNLASQEAVALIAKATEFFIGAMAKESYSFTLQGKRKTVQKKDIDNAIDVTDEFAFLEGTLDS